MSEQTPPAGFYDDGSGTRRYWDGSSWGITYEEALAATQPSVDPQPQSDQPRASRKAILIGTAIAAVVILMATGALALTHRSSASAAAAPIASLSATPTPSNTVPPGSITNVTAPPTPKITTAQEWSDAGGGDAYNLLRVDQATLILDSADPPIPDADCQTLTQDVATAAQAPPIPKAAVQKHWAAVIHQLTIAADMCGVSPATTVGKAVAAVSADWEAVYNYLN